MSKTLASLDREGPMRGSWDNARLCTPQNLSRSPEWKQENGKASWGGEIGKKGLRDD